MKNRGIVFLLSRQSSQLSDTFGVKLMVSDIGNIYSLNGSCSIIAQYKARSSHEHMSQGKLEWLQLIFCGCSERIMECDDTHCTAATTYTPAASGDVYTYMCNMLPDIYM